MSSTKIRILFLALLATPVLVPTLTRAQDEHEHFEAHGGIGKESEGRRFEIAFMGDKVRIYVMDANRQPVDPTGAEGTVQARFRERGRNPVNGTFRYVAAQNGQPAYLEAPLDMARTQEGAAAAVTIRLTKLPGGGEASFQEPFKLARLNEWACPMNCVAPSAAAGNCSKCHMALVQKWFIWACPQHENVTSRAEGKCWVGQENLVKRVSTGEAAHQAPAAGGGGHDQGGHDHGGHGGHKH